MVLSFILHTTITCLLSFYTTQMQSCFIRCNKITILRPASQTTQFNSITQLVQLFCLNIVNNLHSIPFLIELHNFLFLILVLDKNKKYLEASLKIQFIYNGNIYI